MKQERLRLYTIDIKYIRNLAKADDNVMSVSPQQGKSNRPFVGIVIICDKKQYCIPLSSPKEKHKTMKNDSDFSKIYDGDKLIGVLNFNCMIPVNSEVIRPLNFQILSNDDSDSVHYKKLITKQISFCQKNQDAIIKKANKLYDLIINDKASFNLRKRCCDFKKLESLLIRYSENK